MEPLLLDKNGNVRHKKDMHNHGLCNLYKELNNLRKLTKHTFFNVITSIGFLSSHDGVIKW